MDKKKLVSHPLNAAVSSEVLMLTFGRNYKELSLGNCEASSPSAFREFCARRHIKTLSTNLSSKAQAKKHCKSMLCCLAV